MSTMIAVTPALGSLPGWLTVIGIGVAAWIFYRGGGGTAISSLEIANRVLEKRVAVLEADGKEKDRLIAELRGKTDVSAALVPLLDWATAHEKGDLARHEETASAFATIAAELQRYDERAATRSEAIVALISDKCSTQ